SLLGKAIGSTAPSRTPASHASFWRDSGRSVSPAPPAPPSSANTSAGARGVATSAAILPSGPVANASTTRGPETSRVTTPPAAGTRARATARSSSSRNRRAEPSAVHAGFATLRSSAAEDPRRPTRRGDDRELLDGVVHERQRAALEVGDESAVGAPGGPALRVGVVVGA